MTLTQSHAEGADFAALSPRLTVQVQTMMDANLALQIKGAKRDSPASPSQPPGLFAIAPEILTLSGGSLSPFDFGLGKRQHRDLFHAGQLCAHLTAAQLEMAANTASSDDGSDARVTSSRVMSHESKLKVVLHCLHLDYPKRAETPWSARAAAGPVVT